MVVIKRSSRPPTIDVRLYAKGSQLPMGNEETSSYYGRSSWSTPLKSSSSSSSYVKRSSISLPPGWMLPIAYGCVVLSWMLAFKHNNSLSQISLGLDVERSALAFQGEESLRTLNNAKESMSMLERSMEKLKDTQKVMKHEVRKSEEMVDLHPSQLVRETLEGKDTGVVVNRIQQRHEEGLRRKMIDLQSFIQDDSRRQVIEKYGEGPYRVRFLVQNHEAKVDEFVLEMADLQLMPHSVLTFLDMVDSRLWDNALFYHLALKNHVLTAAPVDFGTFERKHHHFAGASFAEYSAAFPHEEFTVGFSARGPNFYINTLDNSEHHGPGGQGHYDLPEDADPCFAKVVSGHGVVKGMLKGKHFPHEQLGIPLSLRDYDLTHIVKAKII